jgi:hypothetical protein
LRGFVDARGEQCDASEPAHSHGYDEASQLNRNTLIAAQAVSMAAALGCHDEPVAEPCRERLAVSIYPLVLALAVGESTRINGSMALPCAHRSIPLDLVVRSSDPATVVVEDSLRGEITAKARGTAIVRAFARFDTSYQANVIVTVEP